MALGAAACAVLAGPAGAADRPDPKQAWALWRAASPVATAAGYIPGLPPELCVGDIWSDQIGTNDEDALEAPNRAQRLWGRAGADYLYGSETRAACLIGGRDPDTLDLWLGGGAAWGEHGSDEIFGSPLDDILDGGDGNDVLVGGDGGDAINGGLGVDGIDGGAGDDMIDSNDGRGEVVRCGDGIDEVVTDGLDALVDCELGWRQGGGAVERLVPSPQAAQSSSVVRFRWTVPEAAGANAYKVVLLSSCAGAPSVLTSFPARGTRVKAGQRVRVGLRPPGNRWCRGKVQTAVTISRRCSSSRGCASAPPPEVLARLSFRAR
jgi:hypothetical protein